MWDVEDYLEAATADDWMTEDERDTLEEWEHGDDLKEDYYQ